MSPHDNAWYEAEPNPFGWDTEGYCLPVDSGASTLKEQKVWVLESTATVRPKPRPKLRWDLSVYGRPSIGMSAHGPSAVQMCHLRSSRPPLSHHHPSLLTTTILPSVPPTLYHCLPADSPSSKPNSLTSKFVSLIKTISSNLDHKATLTNAPVPGTVRFVPDEFDTVNPPETLQYPTEYLPLRALVLYGEGKTICRSG
ncbi:hypothetical protein BV25DRAFT_1843251 [Artomyces pyxidatus]|uniref:Uncharacterized protein n=1 Tax=Artomyces pyxidatus TaxID=48021 RepID=A0ACB8SGF2_9AGAM|nr:hypothetical protein BV25DRAFT_1843251 [Artomyces pyxidatus]